jgi:hypothetical protein
MRIRLLQPVTTASWSWQTHEVVWLDLDRLSEDERQEIATYLRDGIAEVVPNHEDDPKDHEVIPNDPIEPDDKPPSVRGGPRLPKGPKRRRH